MAKRDDLEAAVAAGLIAPDQVEALGAFLQERTGQVAASREEDLRFIRNFHDVFLSIGIVIFALGMMIAGFTYLAGGGGLSSDERMSAWPFAGLFVVCAGAQWGLAELFAKRRRLFLPSIVLCLAFVGFATLSAAAALGEILLRPLAKASPFDGAGGEAAIPLAARLYFVALGLASLALAGAFWARFRLPFALGLLGLIGALVLLAACFAILPDSVGSALSWWSLIAGAALFFLGVWFDARDPERRTLSSDNGFWLHFAAAPFILNGALSLAGGGGFWRAAFSEHGDYTSVAGTPVGWAVITLVVVVGLGLISLLINRRALIVSALLTTGGAIGILVDQLGLDFGGLAAVTLLLLGGVVLLLGAGWHSARRALLGWVKPGGVWARVFPPEAIAE